MKHLRKFNEQIEETIEPIVENYKESTITNNIEWVQASDRFILIQKDEDGSVVGINFMQGNEPEIFKEEYSEPDEDLTKFYNENKHMIKGDNELEMIDNACWLFFSAKNIKVL
jgi:hypothetical protein